MPRVRNLAPGQIAYRVRWRNARWGQGVKRDATQDQELFEAKLRRKQLRENLRLYCEALGVDQETAIRTLGGEYETL